MYGVPAEAITSLRAITIKGVSKRENDTAPDKARSPEYRRCVNEIQGPKLVVRSPSAPISDLLRHLSPVLRIHDPASFDR